MGDNLAKLAAQTVFQGNLGADRPRAGRFLPVHADCAPGPHLALKTQTPSPMQGSDMLASGSPPPVHTDDSRPAPARPPTVRLFGQYLVDQGIIHASDLKEALKLMRVVNSTIGELAVNRGLVTADQAEEIHRLQREIDGRWGDIALTLGVGAASAERIEQLAWEQELVNLRLSDALVEIGVLTATEIDEHLQAYERLAQAAAPPPDLGSPELVAYAEHLRDNLPRLARRVVSSPVRLTPLGPWDGQSLEHHGSITIGAPVHCRIHLSVDRRVGRALTEALAGPEGKGTHRTAEYDAAAAEFLTLLTAQVSRALSVTTDHVPPVGTSKTGAQPAGIVAFEVAFAQGRGVVVLEPISNDDAP